MLLQFTAICSLYVAILNSIRYYHLLQTSQANNLLAVGNQPGCTTI